MTAAATSIEATAPSASNRGPMRSSVKAHSLSSSADSQKRPDLLGVARSHVPRSSSPSATMAAYRAYRDSVRPPVLSTYAIMGFLSSGTYGRVYKARLKSLPNIQQARASAPGGHDEEASGLVFAIKKFKPDKEEHASYSGISQSAMREIALNRELSHENIVTLREVILEDKSIYMVFSYASHDLLQIIHHHSTVARQPIPLPMLKSILFQLLNGVHYLHSNFVLHRDLKPANILLTSSGVIKIGDLGLARVFEAPLQSLYSGDKVVVTIWYRAPELLLGARHYTTKIDMWAIGCIWGELIALRPMFKGEEAKMDPKNKQTPFQTDQFRKIVEVLGTPNKEIWPAIDTMPEYKTWWPHLQQRLEGFSDGLLNWFSTRARPPLQGFSLFHNLLQYDPLRRSSAAEALQDPFFNEVEPLPTKNVFASLASTREGEAVYPARRLIKDDTDPKMVSTASQQTQLPLSSTYQQQMQPSQQPQPQHQLQTHTHHSLSLPQQGQSSSGASLRQPAAVNNVFGPGATGIGSGSGGASKLASAAMSGPNMLLSSATAAGLVGGGPPAPPPAPGSVGSAGPSSATSTTGDGANNSLVGPASVASSTPNTLGRGNGGGVSGAAATAAAVASGGGLSSLGGGSGGSGSANTANRGGLVATATANANRAAKRQKVQQ